MLMSNDMKSDGGILIYCIIKFSIQLQIVVSG